MGRIVEMLQILRADGEYDQKLEPDLSDEDLRKMYRYLVLVRRYSERGVSLQRQGRIGFFIESTGQEASQIGVAYALSPEDWIFPAYREPGVALLRGVPLALLLAQIMGSSQDVSSGRQMPSHYGFKQANFVTPSSPIAVQIPHAVGAGLAAKYKGDKIVTLALLGDGATSHNDFHTGLNFAGVFKAPTIFFVQNNQYAISLPVRRQTASENVAMKAWSYGFEGIQIDGNDVLAVYKATKQAREKALSGGGPTLIEAVTYRIGAHSTSDDPKRYRSEAEVEMWKKRDPIVRFRLYLRKKGLLTEQDDRKIQEDADNELNQAIKEAEKAPPPTLQTLFTDVYSEMPWHLKEEMDELLKDGS